MPFLGIRYHLQDWREAEAPPVTRKELFNLRHSRTRMMVERAFGHLKRRWKIVRNAPAEYDVGAQIKIVYAVTALHNLTLAGRAEDRAALKEADREALSRAREICRRELTDLQQEYIRLRCAEQMAIQYNADQGKIGRAHV